MAQLVARFHGMEEVGGSNPPSSTENIDIRFRVSIFIASAVATLRLIAHCVLLKGWLFSADGAATAAGSFGVPPLSSPGRHGDRRDACERQALFCFCECILRT